MRSASACLPQPVHVLALRAAYVLTTLVCAAGLVAAAVLTPAPSGALPAVIVLAIGLPMVAAWELAQILSTVRHAARHGRALAGLRRDLDALPETRHPLGL